MRWAFRQTEVERATQARKLFSKTLPHFVGAAIIATQQIVCQEKNIILQIFFSDCFLITCIKFRSDLIRATIIERFILGYSARERTSTRESRTRVCLPMTQPGIRN